MDASGLSLAEGAFVSAVVKLMHTQSKMLELQSQLQAEFKYASRANEAVLVEAKIDEMTPLEQAMAYQERLMEAAIERYGKDENDSVVRSVRANAAEFREAVQSMQEAEARQLGQIQGPAL